MLTARSVVSQPTFFRSRWTWRSTEGIVPAPDPLVDGFPVHGAPGIPGKEKEQVVLRLGQVDLLRTPPDPHGGGVDLQSAGFQHHIALLIPPQHHVNPGQQLHGVKGLDNIVLRPQTEALHPIRHRPFGGEKDHRNLQRPDVFHQFEAVHLRQHHIQQDQIVHLPLQQVGRLRSVKGAGAVESLLGQAHTDQVGNGLFVLYNQNANHLRHLFSPPLF